MKKLRHMLEEILHGDPSDTINEPEVVEPEVVEPEVVESNSQMNNWIADSIILIKSRKNGILQSEIQKLLGLSNPELFLLTTKLLRVDGITRQNVHGDGSNFDVY